MPRRRQGGDRQGVPGRAYPNRSDMRSPKVVEFQGQQYGARTAQVEAQQQTARAVAQIRARQAATADAAHTGVQVGGIRFGDADVDTGGVTVMPGQAPPAQAAPMGPGPGGLPSLLDPSTRPDEPLTAGAPFGPGPGPEVLPRLDPDAQAIERLRLVARNTGLPSLLRLLETWEDGE